MSYQKLNDLVIEDARVMFRNFSGKETKFNAAGNRNFCVVIEDPNVADALAHDGWNVRTLPPRDEDEAELNYLNVKTSFDNYPPDVYLVTKSKGKVKSRVKLDEDTISALDHADLVSADLIVRPYNWDMNGKQGVKAYLKSGYFVIEQDAFADKYEVEEDDLPF